MNVRLPPSATLTAPSTRTGDSAGAVSPELAVDPGGMPASHGSDVPGTVLTTDWAETAEAASTSANTVVYRNMGPPL